MFNDKTILITGGTGFIGSHLAEELLKQDPKKIYLFDNLHQSSISNIDHIIGDDRVEFVYCDIREDIMEPYIMKADYLFHLATINMGFAEIYPELAMTTNIGGTFNLMKMCLKNPDIRVVYSSSGSVIGNVEGKTDEDSKLNPESFYAISKDSAEKYVKYFAKEYGVKSSIARYYHVFGPRQRIDGKAGVVCIFLNKVLNNESPCIWGTGEQIKCFTYVKDTVSGTIMLAEKDETIGQIHNIVSDNKVSVNELADLVINKYAKTNLETTTGPAKTGEILSPQPSNKKMKALGWTPEYTFEAGLEETKKWVKSTL